MSGLSLDVCDGNMAVHIPTVSPKISLMLTPFPFPQTNTVVESPAQSTVSPVPFALVTPLPERNPICAAGEWRDREAERRKKKHGKIHHPGVTWDLGEDPPEPPAGSSTKKLLCRCAVRSE